MRLRTILEELGVLTDDDGKPLVVYHGTNNNFEKFDVNKVGENTGNYGHYGYGIYFSDSEKEAKTYGKIVKKYHLQMSKPFTATDDQYLELRELGWNVGDYEKTNIKFDSVVKNIKDPELKTFAQYLIDYKDKAWDEFFAKYPNNKNNKLNEIYDLYEMSDASGHNGGVDMHALPLILEELPEVKEKDLEYNEGFTYKTPLHYVTETGAYGKNLTEDLKKLGYDGVIYGSEFVIFDADQAELIQK